MQPDETRWIGNIRFLNRVCSSAERLSGGHVVAGEAGCDSERLSITKVRAGEAALPGAVVKNEGQARLLPNDACLANNATNHGDGRIRRRRGVLGMGRFHDLPVTAAPIPESQFSQTATLPILLLGVGRQNRPAMHYRRTAMLNRQRRARLEHKPLLSVEEAADLLGRSRSSLYRSINRGDLPLPVYRISGRYCIPRRAVERFLDGDVVA
jgi:excisionase family DNA binding protein